MLASQSEYFSTALRNGFQEPKIKRFEYQEGSLQAYWRVFQYMYTGSYSDDPAPELDVKGMYSRRGNVLSLISMQTMTSCSETYVYTL